MQTKRKTTSVDVARAVGVAQSTVSRAFGGDEGVGEATRQQIFKAARKLNYTPNALARSLIKQKTNIVGIVMAGITSPSQSDVLEKFVGALHAAKRQALVFTAHEDEVESVLPLVLQYQVEALIVTSAPLWSQKLEDCARRVPVILFNRVMPLSKADSVACDNAGGGRQVADYLMRGGHKRFAYIAGNANTSTNKEREQGFVTRLKKGGFDCVREAGTYAYEAGEAAMQRLLSRKQKPDAVFCASDIIALGAIDAARRMSARVPEDVSIVGFDNIPMAGWAAYQLTTVREPVDLMIEAALKLLEARSELMDGKPVAHRFAGELIERASVKPRTSACVGR